MLPKYGTIKVRKFLGISHYYKKAKETSVFPLLFLFMIIHDKFGQFSLQFLLAV